jgi:hypothetical protein
LESRRDGICNFNDVTRFFVNINLIGFKVGTNANIYGFVPVFVVLASIGGRIGPAGKGACVIENTPIE